MHALLFDILPINFNANVVVVVADVTRITEAVFPTRAGPVCLNPIY
jgi:hypothetical protein